MRAGISKAWLGGVLILCLIIPPAYAWNAVGHEVVASIAYDHLTPQAKTNVDALTARLDHKHHSGYLRFLQASVWADRIKGHDIHAFDTWHFIDQPYLTDNTTQAPPLAPNNITWAIQQAVNTLQSHKASSDEKALFLRFLIHFVGDAHQPLHCISHYSTTYPHGDKGGGLIPIQSTVAENLHAYWDRGAGLFAHINPYRMHNIAQIAHTIDHQHAPHMPGTEQLNPRVWANNSYQIAKNTAYHIKENTRPTAAYTQRAQHIVSRQIALAGYRLAIILNQIF